MLSVSLFSMCRTIFPAVVLSVAGYSNIDCGRWGQPAGNRKQWDKVHTPRGPKTAVGIPSRFLFFDGRLWFPPVPLHTKKRSDDNECVRYQTSLHKTGKPPLRPSGHRNEINQRRVKYDEVKTQTPAHTHEQTHTSRGLPVRSPKWAVAYSHALDT